MIPDFTRYVAVEYTADQTEAEIIPSPGGGKTIVIWDIVVSTGAAGTVLFEVNGDTRLFGRLSLAANGGWSFNSTNGVRVGANKSLTLTSTTGAGPLSVHISYTLE